MKVFLRKRLLWVLPGLCVCAASVIHVLLEKEVRASSDGRAYWDETVDDDADGLPDDWERHYFSGLEGAGFDGDPDLDGYTNGEEWQRNTNPVLLDPRAIGESGMVDVTQVDAGQWHTIRLEGVYENPVVLMGPTSGGQPATVRVRNVSPSSFDFQIDEYEYMDGWHLEERMSWVVVEEGVYVLPGGAVLQAGYGSVPAEGASISFHEDFTSVPVVMSQVTTYAGSYATTPQQSQIGASGFEVILRNQESHVEHTTTEELAWIAVEKGLVMGTSGEFEVGESGVRITHQWSTQSFQSTRLPEVPVLHASMQTANGADTATIRYRNLSESSVQLHIMEETSQDNETQHAAENVGYLVSAPGIFHVLSSEGDQNANGLADAWEQSNGLSGNVYYGDEDGDGLKNWEEYREGTRADLADSDGDGVSDFDEVRFFESDALANDVEAFEWIATIPGADYVESWGQWRRGTEGEARIESPRGSVDFDLTVAAAGVHALEVNYEIPVASAPDASQQFAAWLNGDYLGRVHVDASGGGFRFLTPWLNAGTHRLTVLWDNTRYMDRAVIGSIGLYGARGVDSDGSGAADWTEIRTRNQNGLVTFEERSLRHGRSFGDGFRRCWGKRSRRGGHGRMPEEFQRSWKMMDQWAAANREWIQIAHSSGHDSHEFGYLVSRTSPACVEGKARYPGLLHTDGPVTPSLLPNDHWYLDLPLSTDQPMTQTFSFEGEHFAETLSVFWVPTNLAEESELLVREGDSLLLNASVGRRPEASRKADIWIDGELFPEVAFDEPLPYEFAQAGTVEIQWALRRNPHDSAYEWEGTVLVEVAPRPSLEPVKCGLGFERPWSISGLHENSLVQIDDEVAVYDATELGSGAWSYRLAVSDTDPQPLAVRLGHDGLILATTMVEGLRSESNLETGLFIVSQNGDGSNLYEMPLFLSGDLEGISVEVSIYRAGVNFINGEVTLMLTEEDFDEFGFATLRFVVPQGVDANCHIIRIFQDGVELAQYNN